VRNSAVSVDPKNKLKVRLLKIADYKLWVEQAVEIYTAKRGPPKKSALDGIRYRTAKKFSCSSAGLLDALFGLGLELESFGPRKLDVADAFMNAFAFAMKQTQQ
jgi:hypothetical protein